MDHVRLGRSELWVTRVGMGGIPVQRLGDEEAVRVIRHCLDRGVNYIDTAHGYGSSEEYFGKAFTGRKSGVIIASKSPAKDRAGFMADLEVSLRRLRVEQIDLYQLHNVATKEEYIHVLDSGGALEGARDALQMGKIGHIGITSHSLEVAKIAVQSGLFETVMFPLNFVAREPGEELYPLAVEHDVGFVAMKPLAGGMLSNAQLAFRYLAQFPHAVPIPGIEKAQEIDEIIAIVDEKSCPSKAELVQMKRIRKEVGNRFCRRCEYCQPCPQGIAISSLMLANSMFKRMPVERFLEMSSEAVQKATACEKCGECETRCPYGLPIRDMMDESLALYRREKAKYEASLKN